jgi:ubiquinone/menaquinone biosynthesis C-methylase UbiE
MDQRERIAAMFDQVADSYDQVGVELFQPIADRLVHILAPRPGERALDLGCGRGAALLRLAAGVGPTGRALGMDLVPRRRMRPIPQVVTELSG